MSDRIIAVIGAGNMGEALIHGLLSKGNIKPSCVIAADPRVERLRLVSDAFGIRTTLDNASAASIAGVILIAVKPQQIGEALSSIKEAVDRNKLVISIAAGVSSRRIESELGAGVRVVRAMPNTPAQIGAGATGLSMGSLATEEDMAAATELLGAVGLTVRVDEQMLDAVTGLSGSGPAYLFLVAEAMIQGGIAAGLAPDVARSLSIQTLLGAARVLDDSDEEPGQLRRRVTSPDGTTEAALKVMEGQGFVQIFIDAILAATRRSRELAGS